MRILIAEDEVTIARALKVMLEKNKYAVDLVHNGNDALDYLRATGYDALVLDIMMPELNGYDVCRQLKADPRTESIPVILCLRWRRWAMRPMALQPERWTTSSSPCVHLWCVPVCARTCRW